MEGSKSRKGAGEVAGSWFKRHQKVSGNEDVCKE